VIELEDLRAILLAGTLVGMSSEHSRDRGRWSEPGVPHKGWRCVDTYDRGQDQLESCEMCDAAEVRYVHVMQHDEYPNPLHVGCVCAGHMESDLVRARGRETRVKNRSKRRAKWLERKGWRASTAKGNPTIKVEGYQVTVFPRGARFGWSIVGGEFKFFSPENYETQEAAALGAFDRFEKLMGRD